MKTCSYCGMKNADTARSCPGCGTNDFIVPGQAELETSPLSPKQQLGWLLAIAGTAVLFGDVIFSASYYPSEVDYYAVGAKLSGALFGAVLQSVGLYLRSSEGC